jgi:dienelactone hydrolase
LRRCLTTLLSTTFAAMTSVAAFVTPETCTAPSQEEPNHGASTVTFTDRDPRSSIQEQAKRFNWKMNWVKHQDSTGGEYDLAQESFRLFVPASYRPDTPHGLVVWISPAKTGGFPADWPPVFERHKLLAIGADSSGNDRLVWYRVGLAVDAGFNMRQRHSVDERRVYVVGFSGGGRTASRVAMTYSDIFTGGIYIAGADYFRPVQVPGQTRKFWPSTFPAPTGRRAEIVKYEQRHVFLIGSDDPSLTQVRSTVEYARTRDSFAHAHFLEMPGVGHTCADAENLERAIELLDEPIQPNSQ